MALLSWPFAILKDVAYYPPADLSAKDSLQGIWLWSAQNRRALAREIFRPKDLPNLNGVAFVRGTALCPLHHVFLGRCLHQPVTA